jgi:chemotaxis protein histidine kinase CheA
MTTYERLVAQVRRRIVGGVFAVRLAWSLFATMGIAAAAIAVSKYWRLGVEDHAWTVAWLVGGAVAGLAVALISTALVSPTPMQAAIELDRRCHLKERISSLLSLDAETRESSVGQALLADADQRLQRVDIAQHFPLLADRRALLPMASAALAIGLTFLEAPSEANVTSTASTATQTQQKQVQNALKPLEKRLAEKKDEAKQKGLEDAANLMQRVEDGAKKLAQSDEKDRTQALVKLNDLSREIEKRKAQLGGNDALKQQMQKLSRMEQGPADNLAKAMKSGDLKMAIKELDKLKSQLDNKDGKPLSDGQKKELTKQLESMQKSLRDMAERHDMAKRELEQLIQQKKKAGDLAEAGKLQQKLDEMNKQSPATKQAKELSDQLAKAAQAMQQGDPKAAKSALDELGQQMQSLAKAEQEMKMLDDALAQISECKAGMVCQNCNGQGCEECQGGNCKGGNPFQIPKQGKGSGLGAAIGGRGPRPEEKNDGKFYNTKDKPNVGKGPSIFAGEIEGPNIKGQVEEAIKGEIAADVQDSADAQTGQKLPRGYQERVGDYFNKIRKGRTE